MSAPATKGSRFGLLVTNLSKLAGLVGGINEAIGPARPSAVLFWVALYLGAQALEDLLARLIDRALGSPDRSR